MMKQHRRYRLQDLAGQHRCSTADAMNRCRTRGADGSMNGVNDLFVTGRKYCALYTGTMRMGTVPGMSP